ncbi:MAG: ABC transporter permease [Deltaproteobacteria bacterium]|nr:ABC transporter permease [Deltaproteobacteria bacterium]
MAKNVPDFRFEGPLEGGLFVLSGNLNAFTAPKALLVRFGKAFGGLSRVRLDLGKLEHLDLNGAAILIALMGNLGAKKIDCGVQNVPEHLLPIWELALKNHPSPETLREPEKPDVVTLLGMKTARFLADLRDLVSFLGETLTHLLGFLFSPWRIRWGDFFALAERSVVNAIPVTCLVSFLVGLILAFQSAMLMQLFGVEIFVADLVGIAMIRELGTLLTAIVLTGRSGSAFSSELASMKSNQEIDAFVTMGLSPARDLAVPRILALTAATPLLTILADFTGLIGGNIVMISMGHPYMVFWEELSGHVDASDMATGLFKAVVFGFTVALIGCQRGLYADQGPTAVGEATTRGVVTNIIAIAILDSLFAVLFYALRW